LDVDGNGSADALSDGILILRYLSDPTGQWNVVDALGSGATRTTLTDIKAYLDLYNPSLSPSAPMMTAAMVSAEDPSPQSQAASSSLASITVDTTEPVKSCVEPVNGSDADQVRATISQALVIGGIGTVTTIGVDQKSMPEEDSQPNDLPAIDAALDSWDQPAPYGVPWGLMPNQRRNDDAEADEVWGEDGLDWFLTKVGDDVNDQETGAIINAL
jgi:hypothetical protein